MVALRPELDRPDGNPTSRYFAFASFPCCTQFFWVWLVHSRSYSSTASSSVVKSPRRTTTGDIRTSATQGPTLYTNIRVFGWAARHLYATLALKSSYSTVYSSFVRRLRYTITSTSESFLTYPVFCQALLTTDNLVSLSLDLFPGQAEALISSMKRYGLLRMRVLTATRLLNAHLGVEQSVASLSLPRLRGLRISGDPSVAILLCDRDMDEIVLSSELGYKGLSELCCVVDRSLYGHNISTLFIRLEPELIARDVVLALSEILPNLEQFSLDQRGLDAMHVLDLTVSPRRLFRGIRRLAINPISGWLPASGASRREFADEMCLWLAAELDLQSPLVRLSLAATVWTLDIATFSWSATSRVDSVIIVTALSSMQAILLLLLLQSVKVGEVCQCGGVTLYRQCGNSTTRSYVWRDVTVMGRLTGPYISGSLNTPLELDRRGRRQCSGVILSPTDRVRYRAIAVISSGASGLVLKAIDTRRRRLVAVKLYHPSRRGLGEAEHAVSVCRAIFSRSGGHTRFFVRVLDIFFDGDARLVFPLGGVSLAGLLDGRRFVPLPPCYVRSISWQIAKALEYLHSLDLIHTDVKPANIILASDATMVLGRLDASGRTIYKVSVFRSLRIKLVDLDDVVEAGCRWSKPLDVFSFGCVFAELCNGVSLFSGDCSPSERLAAMERTIGVGDSGYRDIPTDSMLPFTRRYPPRIVFDPIMYGQEAIARSRSMTTLTEMLPCWTAFNLCRWLLALDPARRPSFGDVLSHPYFACQWPDPDSRSSYCDDGGVSVGSTAAPWDANVPVPEHVAVVTSYAGPAGQPA
ncbi:kinase-like domain-containing protein [Mycena galericulata]|nr:kinase-like domain-containing protein [Mycena galericulata]